MDRMAAHRVLTRLTGQDYGFEVNRAPKLQGVALGRWRDYLGARSNSPAP